MVQGIVTGKYFWFYGSMCLVSITALILSVLNKISFHVSLTDGFVLLFMVSVFISACLLNGASVNTYRFVLLSLLLVLYLCIRLVFDGNHHKSQLLFFFIILTGLVEAIWGLMQLYGFRMSQHSLFKLTGSFFNPGPYAGYLAVVFPLALHCFLDKKKQQSEKDPVSIDIVNFSPKSFNVQAVVDLIISFMRKWVCGITCFSILLVLPAAMSRASWIAVMAGSIVVIVGQQKCVTALKKHLFKNESKVMKIIAFIMVVFLVVAVFIGMYYLKKDSADGRLLTWKVSLSALVQHPMGVGLGHFPNAYGEAQAAYFASGNSSETEKHVAGNPEYGFNEFLQIAIESGIVALLLFIGMLVCAFRGLIMQKNWGGMGSLVSLLVFACFSYPFSVLPFLIIFVFLLAMGATKSAQVTQTQVRKRYANSVLIHSIRFICVPAGCMIITAFCLWSQYPVYGAYKQWKSYQVFYQVGMYNEAAQNYEPLYPYLHDQIKFLFEYGRSLSQSGQSEKSNEVLQHAIQISCDPMLYNIMGKNYQSMKEYDLAEKNFHKATLIVPNRLYPYYLLMKLFIETGNTEKALENAKIVLTKEPKVQSTAINEMREEAKKIL